jgi:hypothetical protein
VNTLSAHLDRQDDEISNLRTGLTRAHKKIGSLEMSSALVWGRVSTLEDVMEAVPTPTDLTSEDLEYADVDDGGAMMVEDSKDERENMLPPPPIIRTATPLPPLVLQELIPIKDPAPVRASFCPKLPLLLRPW